MKCLPLMATLVILLGCEDISFPKQLMIESGCDEVDKRLIRLAADEINSSMAHLVGMDEIIKISAERFFDYDGFSRDDLEDGNSVIYCLQERSEETEIYHTSGMGTGRGVAFGLLEDIVFSKPRLSITREKIKKNILEYNEKYYPEYQESDDDSVEAMFVLMCQEYWPPDWEIRSYWPNDIEQSDYEYCVPQMLHIYINEMLHYLGVGHVESMEAVMLSGGTAVRISEADRSAFCCRYECVAGSPECDWQKYNNDLR